MSGPKPIRDSQLRPNQLKRFSNYVVDANGCWIWTGRLDRKHLYGLTSHNNRPTMAHRLFYEHFVGAIPDGYVVHHKCSVPACVNPDHLEPLSVQENIWRKPNLKLTPKQVEEIRYLGNTIGVAATTLSGQFGVPARHIRRVLTGGQWLAVGGPIRTKLPYTKWLTDKEKAQIRQMRAEGHTQTYIAKRFGVCSACISRMLKKDREQGGIGERT